MNQRFKIDVRDGGRHLRTIYRLSFSSADLPVGYVNYRGKIVPIHRDGAGLYLDEKSRWSIKAAHPLRPKTRGDA